MSDHSIQQYYLRLKSDGETHDQAVKSTAKKFNKSEDDIFDIVLDVAREAKEEAGLKHLVLYENFDVNEGIGSAIRKGLKKVKEIFTGGVYRVSYTVTEYEKSEKDKDPEEKRHYRMDVNLKANGKDDARSKLLKMFERRVEGMKPKPTVKVNKITYTDDPADKEPEIII